MDRTFAVAIGGAAGQGVATPGDIFAKLFVRRGPHINAYNAYQSIIRGGHTFLTIRAGIEEVRCFGDRIDLLIPLNQDSIDRHLRLMHSGSGVIYNGDTIRPDGKPEGVQLCPLPVSELSKESRSKVEQNTLALGASLRLMGMDFEPLAEVLKEQFLRKGDKVVAENLNIARAGYDLRSRAFQALCAASSGGQHVIRSAFRQHRSSPTFAPGVAKLRV
jgi:2-oxoglutarate ferredoxin oxidoreductase subunit alpha